MNIPLKQKLQERSATICVIGLGYVGLTTLDAFAAQGFTTTGYDRNKHKIEGLLSGINYVKGIDIPSLFPLIKEGKCHVTCDTEGLGDCDVFIITVPTSLDAHGMPELTNIKNAAHIIAKQLKKGCLVVMQSTSFPSTTETVILPILKQSHLKEGVDFHLAFTPEVSDFGNVNSVYRKIPKIVAGLTRECTMLCQELYMCVVEKVCVVPSIKVAEAAKILQNAYRLINISFINEMKMMFDGMDIDIWDVIAAASTKPFGFTPFYPGPGIGGDCIPVDPAYMVWKAKETSGPTTMLERALDINEKMSSFVVGKVIHALGMDNTAAPGAKVLVLGVAFKKDVNDIRESSSLKILTALKREGIEAFYHDPHVQSLVPSAKYPHMHMSSLQWEDINLKDFDCVVILTDHSFYCWEDIAKRAKRIVDTRGVMKKGGLCSSNVVVA